MARGGHNFIDLTGKSINSWHVKSRHPRKKVVSWLCVCTNIIGNKICGNEAIVLSCNLLRGSSKMCATCAGLIRIKKMHTARSETAFTDYTGLKSKSGLLTVTSNSNRKSKNGDTIVWAECSCEGNIKEYAVSKIKNGNTKSCGCLKISSAKNTLFTYVNKDRKKLSDEEAKERQRMYRSKYIERQKSKAPWQKKKSTNDLRRLQAPS